MPIPAGYKPFVGSERPPLPGSILLRPADPAERIDVAVLVRQKPGSHELPDLQYWQHVHPSKRKFLSAEEFYESFGSAEEEMEAVASYLSGKGLRILSRHAGQGEILAQGSAADLNSAFGIALNRYQAPKRTLPRRPKTPWGEEIGAIQGAIDEHEYRGFEGPVHLPAKLIDIVIGVIGLDDRQISVPAGAGTGDPPGAQYLTPQEVAKAYNFPTNLATGQTIGLYEDAANGFNSAAYLPSDISSFIGAGTPPHIANIGLLGQSNVPALVNPFNGGAFECTCDIEIAAAVAPGVNINVYFTTGGVIGWHEFFKRALFPLAGDNPPSVLSASWAPYLTDNPSLSGSPGLHTVSGSDAFILHRDLRRAAARGITVLMAIGDWGANNLMGGTSCNVTYPSCDPWVTACGGTILGQANAAPPPLIDEVVWSDANLPLSIFDSAPYDATGGGVSDQFPIPPFQAAEGILPISKNDGWVRRGVPDVAGMIGIKNFFFSNAGGAGGVGTSFVAPLYAGLVALINSFLGRNVGFLNPTLYQFGPQVCNDITFGNNDSGLTPDAPFYTAAIGWDACTGWGSINGMRLRAALAPAPIIVTAIPDSGNFGTVCAGAFVDETLTINNSGFAPLLIWKITSSYAGFLTPGVLSYPLVLAPGASIDVTIRFEPIAPGTWPARITIYSNDLAGPHIVDVIGTRGEPRLVLAIADSGYFGKVCRGSFADEPLVLNNAGTCSLSVTGITCTPGEFLLPDVQTYPLALAPGASLALPIRLQATSLGSPTATITVSSNDPHGPQTVQVSGSVPSGRLVVTGSTFFGRVTACCREERVIWLCNVGDCALDVTSVAFKRRSRHWKLVNNPFPASLHSGAGLALTIAYLATEKFPHPQELIITSDDPTAPIKSVDLVATTVWNACGEAQRCESCDGKRACSKDCGCGERCCGGERGDDDDDQGGEE